MKLALGTGVTLASIVNAVPFDVVEACETYSELCRVVLTNGEHCSDGCLLQIVCWMPLRASTEIVELSEDVADGVCEAIAMSSTLSPGDLSACADWGADCGGCGGSGIGSVTIA
eukprot:3800106-Amphidinium_carterae.2